jgi:uncharacterized Zn-binding protein involved in type VI secretion
MRNVIRLGDMTSSGGRVLSTQADHFKVGGVPVACVGDPCSCPICGPGCKIATGSPNHVINGAQVAFDGDLTTCGARLISSATNFQAE